MPKLSVTVNVFLALLACAVGLQAQQVGTSLSLTASPSTAVTGQTVTLTATLTTASVSISSTDGLRVRVAGVGLSCSALLKGGVAACKATVQPVQDGPPYQASGYASFGGNSQFRASTSNVVDVAIVTHGANVPTSLEGPYIFQFDGYTDAAAAPGVAPAVAGLGRLVADGQGNLTGEVTYNGSALSLISVPVTGTYSMDTSGIGTLTVSGGGYTQHFDLFVGLPATTGVPDGSLLETDGSFLWGSATLRSQTAVTLPLDPAAEGGIFHSVLAGETACGDCSSTGHASGGVRAVWSAKFTAATAAQGPLLTVEGDQTIKNSTVEHVSLGGQYVAPDALGKMTVTLDRSGIWSDSPNHLLGYMVDATHLALLSTDAHANYILLSGEAVR